MRIRKLLDKGQSFKIIKIDLSYFNVHAPGFFEAHRKKKIEAFVYYCFSGQRLHPPPISKTQHPAMNFIC